RASSALRPDADTLSLFFSSLRSFTVMRAMPWMTPTVSSNLTLPAWRILVMDEAMPSTVGLEALGCLVVTGLPCLGFPGFLLAGMHPVREAASPRLHGSPLPLVR